LFWNKREPRGELKEVCDVMFERFMMVGLMREKKLEVQKGKRYLHLAEVRVSM